MHKVGKHMLLELEERKVKVFVRWAGIKYKKS